MTKSILVFISNLWNVFDYATKFSLPYRFEIFEIQYKYWKRLVLFIVRFNIVLVELTSPTDLA